MTNIENFVEIKLKHFKLFIEKSVNIHLLIHLISKHVRNSKHIFIYKKITPISII